MSMAFARLMNSQTWVDPTSGSCHPVAGSCSLPATRAGEARLTWERRAGAIATIAERSNRPRLQTQSTTFPFFTPTLHVDFLLRGRRPSCDSVFVIIVLAAFTRGRQPCEV
jgi:hypothetical protein